MKKSYYIRKTTLYDDGLLSRSYLMKFGLFEEYTSRIENAMRFDTRSQAKKFVDTYIERRKYDSFEIVHD